MDFAAPMPFEDALALARRQRLLPTSLGSAEISQIASQLLERSFFSATMERASILQTGLDLVTDLADGIGDKATARLQLREALSADGYLAADGEGGTIKDFSTDQRLNLILETNLQQLQGYGEWAAGQDPDVLDAFPCQELLRVEDRDKPRDWIARWQDAGGQLYAGRMIARKDDDIWSAISAFGTPYPPFDFNSGMGVQDVGRTEAEQLGVITRDDTVEPQSRDIAQDAGASADAYEPALLDEIRSLGFRIDSDGVLRTQREGSR